MTDRKTALGLTLLVLAFVALTLTQDFLKSGINNSAFYFSESFMFSSFWWLFAPLLFIQYIVVVHDNNMPVKIKASIIILPFIFHLFAFPLLVWLLSSLFYYHTYIFVQIFRYTLSEHLYLLILFYTIPVLAFMFFKRHTKKEDTITAVKIENNSPQYISSLIVSDANKKYPIAVKEVLFFSANPPYINIQLQDKKYLDNNTLKSMQLVLNPQQFVRVHKSTIVNIEMVVTHTSRLNGDYDLLMKNDVQLRLSRNYAAAFKTLYNEVHRLATK